MAYELIYAPTRNNNHFIFHSAIAPSASEEKSRAEEWRRGEGRKNRLLILNVAYAVQRVIVSFGKLNIYNLSFFFFFFSENSAVTNWMYPAAQITCK